MLFWWQDQHKNIGVNLIQIGPLVQAGQNLEDPLILFEVARSLFVDNISKKNFTPMETFLKVFYFILVKSNKI